MTGEMFEPFAWIAILTDGRHVRMGEPDRERGGEISSSRLDASAVSAIRLLPMTSDGQTVEVQIDLPRGERFVRFWRTIVIPAQGTAVRVNVVGIQAHDGTEYRLYVFPNGKIIMSSSDLNGALLGKGEEGA